MPPFPKPSELAEWASGPNANIRIPLPGERALGWVPGQAPKAGDMNWLMRRSWEWQKYLSTFPDTLAETALVVTARWDFNGGADFLGGVTVGGGLTVTGNSSVAGTFGVTGNTTVGGTFGVAGDTTVGGTLGVAGALTVAAGGAAITGNSTVAGTLGVTGAATVGGALTVSSGGAAITGNSTVAGTLGVTGAITGASLNVGAGAVSAGPVSGTTGTFSGAVSVGSLTVGAWVGASTGFIYGPGWSNPASPSESNLQVRLLPWGDVELRGSAQVDVAPDKFLACTLNPTWRPAVARQGRMSYGAAGIGRFTINPTGEIVINTAALGGSGITSFHFDGVVFSL